MIKLNELVLNGFVSPNTVVAAYALNENGDYTRVFKGNSNDLGKLGEYDFCEFLDNTNDQELLNEKLIQSDSEEAFKKNVETEIKDGKPQKQAVAIAYAVKNKNSKEFNTAKVNILVTPKKKDSKALNEGLSVAVSNSDAKGILQVPLGRLMNVSSKDILLDIKDKDNGKEVSDYLISKDDRNLNLGLIINYIKKYGDFDQKQVAKKKLDYFTELKNKAQNDKTEKLLAVPYSSMYQLYKVYFRIHAKQQLIKEAANLHKCFDEPVDVLQDAIDLNKWLDIAKNNDCGYTFDDYQAVKTRVAHLEEALDDYNGYEHDFAEYFSEMDRLADDSTDADGNKLTLHEYVMQKREDSSPFEHEILNEFTAPWKYRDYKKYTKAHILNVKRGFRWLRRYCSELFTKDKFAHDRMRIMKRAIHDHDKDKFDKDEIPAYNAHFYGEHDAKEEEAFSKAWNKHQHINQHHWQYWVLINADGKNKALDMPEECIIEMICDWWSFSWKNKDPESIFAWYKENKDSMILSSATKDEIESILKLMKSRMTTENTKEIRG